MAAVSARRPRLAGGSEAGVDKLEGGRVVVTREPLGREAVASGR